MPAASSPAANRTEASIHSRAAPCLTSIFNALGNVEISGLVVSSLAISSMHYHDEIRIFSRLTNAIIRDNEGRARRQ